ncbi:MAG: AEC family transporter [Kiritimatiellae bacterium]|nr:AEC family transporter [Kiritimatiellia bacterium]
MSIAFTSILPICLLIALGTVLNQKNFLPAAFFKQLNRLGFYVLLPALLFHSISNADANSIAPGLRIGMLLCGCSLAVALVGWLAAKALKLPLAGCRALAQAAMRGNLAFSGLPIVLFTFGADSEIALLAILSLTPAIPFFNLLAVLILTPYESAPQGRVIRNTVLGVAGNPLVISCLLGILALTLQLKIPAPLQRTVKTLGEAALPCALLSLGAALSFSTLKTKFYPALIAAMLKTLLMPLLGFSVLLISATADHATLLTAMIFLASPTAVTSYVMAEQMGADKELAAAAVTLSTICAMPVTAIILYLLARG